MTDNEYKSHLRDVDCCQNCTQFSLGLHFDGCSEGWCYHSWKIHKREDVCDKYKRRMEQES